uniref:Uncharacterized protein n=1 Tax=Mus musculus TaxID=10090 RepID=Q3TRD6_MOUSE|nr:unnamed protein product [Mus musculus]
MKKKEKKKRKRKRKKSLFCLRCQKSVWCQTLQMTVQCRLFPHFVFGSCLLRHLIPDVKTVMCATCSVLGCGSHCSFCVFLYAVYAKLL